MATLYYTFVVLIVAVAGQSTTQIQRDTVYSDMLKCLWDNADWTSIADASPRQATYVNPVKWYMPAMEEICSKPIAVMTCINTAARNSKKHADLLIARLLLPANMYNIMDYVCLHLSTLEKHSKCGWMSLMHQLLDKQTCLHKGGADLEDMKDYLYSDDPQGEFSVSTLCSNVPPMPDCVSSVVESCGGKLPHIVKTLSRMLVNACGKPDLAELTSGGPDKTSQTFVLFSGLSLLLAYIM